MAVYPERIILKETTDSEVATLAEIGVNGPGEISAGELVIRRDNGYFELYGRTADNQVVNLLTGFLSSSDIADLGNVSITEPVSTGSILEWNGSAWVNAPSQSYDLSANNLTDIGNVNIVGSTNGEALVYNPTQSRWENQRVSIFNLLEVEPLTLPASGLNNATLVAVYDAQSDSLSFQVKAQAISALLDDVGLVTTSNPFTLGELSNVDSGVDNSGSTVPTGSVLAWSGSAWTHALAPAPDLSVSSIEDLGDVTFTTLLSDQVLKYDGVAGAFKNETLSYSDFVDAPTVLSDFANDLSLNDFPNNVGYIDNLDDHNLSEIGDVIFTGLASGDVLSYDGTEWVNAAAPPADISGSSIRSLNDVSVDANSRIRFDNVFGLDLTTLTAATAGQSLGIESSTEYIEIYATRDLDDQGARLSLSRQYGYEFRSDVPDFHLIGNPNSTGNEPVLYWHSGSRTTGYHLGLKSHPFPTQSVVYTLPRTPGAVNQVLATNGTTHELFWQDSSSISELGQLGDVDLVTYPVQDGNVITWDAAAGKWLAAAQAADLSSQSIDDFGDVNTTGDYAPANAQALLFHTPSGEWRPGDVVINTPESLGELNDVDLITSPPLVAQALIYDGTNWVAGAVPGTVSNLQLVGDVYYDTALVDGQFLRYDSTNSEWRNHNPVIGDNVDVDFTTPPADEQLLRYDNASSSWLPYTSVLGDISDVDLVTNTPADGKFLGWSSNLNKFTVLDPQLVGNIDDLADVNTAGVQDGEVLAYNQVAAAWEPLELPVTQETIASTTAPATRADGSSLLNNDQWWKTDTNELYIYEGGSWESPSPGSIDNLVDVDTSTTPPISGQVLEWNGTSGKWEPATVSGGGGATGGHVEETQTSSSGVATFIGLGASGILQKITSDVDAWVVLYSSAAERTADSTRAFADDPDLSSGVLASFYILAGQTIVASPGTTYFNNDSSPTAAIYVATRDQAGADITAQVTISGYASGAATDYVSLTDLKAEVAASTDFADFQSRIAAL